MSNAPLNSSDLASKVKNIISETMLIPADDISESSSFEELGIDSLGGLTIVGELEDVFNVAIPNEKALQITNIAQAVSCLEEALDPSKSSLD